MASKSSKASPGYPISVAKARPPNIVRSGEIGYTGLNWSGGQLMEEFLPELKGKLALRVYKEMRDNDPIVGAILFAVGMLIRQASWKVIPASDEAADKEIAEFVDSCRLDMSMTWADVLSEVMTMLPFGWAYLETVYKKRDGFNRDTSKSSRFNDGRIGWRKLPLRSQDSLDSWELDDRGGLVGMHQLTKTSQKAYIPIERALLFRTESNKNSPEGRSILRNSYRPWYFKKRIEEIEGIGIERDLAGLPVMQTPEGLNIWDREDSQATQMRVEAEKVVRNIRRDEQEGVVLPFGWELTLLSSGGRRAMDTTEVIGRYNNSIAMSIMADFIVLGHNNRYGSFALASSKSSAFAHALGGWLQAISDVFNRYAIPRLLLVNGLPIENPPRLDPGKVETPDLEELGNYIQKLSGAGFQLFPNIPIERYLLGAAGIPTEGVELGREPKEESEGPDTPDGDDDDKPKPKVKPSAENKTSASTKKGGERGTRNRRSSDDEED